MSNRQPSSQSLLSSLPSVDEILKGRDGGQWLSLFPRTIVLQAIREILSGRRSEIIAGGAPDTTTESLSVDMRRAIERLLAFSLRPVINATGIVIHTNLGRSPLSRKVLENVAAVGSGYSNVEYDLSAGKRGKRHIHVSRLLQQITGAEDALIVNNNAAAVLICLSAMAQGKEVVVSRGELVEIGGSFRIPDVMTASGAVLHEIGTTNKTHLQDYVGAINDSTALLLKVHQSNYRMIGFTADVDIRDLVSLGQRHGLPVMFDLGSGCLVDLKPYGIQHEPSVQDMVKAGVDLVTFSGDKLLGGPQGGIIVGRKQYIEQIRKNPLARAVRIDKLTLAAFESIFMEYLDPDGAKQNIPALSMLLQSPREIRARARRLASAVKRLCPGVTADVVEDVSLAGGGSLPGVEFPTFAVAVKPSSLSVNELEARLRTGSPPVIARIRENALLLDSRSLGDREITAVAEAVAAAVAG